MFTKRGADGAVWFDDGGYWEGAEGFTGGDAASEDVGISACGVDDVFVAFGEGER